MDSEVVPTAASLEPRLSAVIKKVPGKIPPPPKDREACLGNLSSKSMADLKELLDRQNMILSNKSLVSKLADKGAKAAELRARIEKELQARNNVDSAANLLSEMSLGQLNALEWTGHCNPGHRSKSSSSGQNPDADETDPLKILASHCGMTDKKKQISIIKPEESLIKPEDIADSTVTDCSVVNKSSAETAEAQGREAIHESKLRMEEGAKNLEIVQGPGKAAVSQRDGSGRIASLPGEPEPYAHFICERFGHKDCKDRFKPNKPLKPFTGQFPGKPPGRVSSKPKRWEETNVTPPIPVHGDTKLLSLEESIELQREQVQRTKDVQMKHAAEKLSSLLNIQMTKEIPANVLKSMAYRGPTESSSDSEEEMNEADLEDQELHDEDQLDNGTTVVYNIES